MAGASIGGIVSIVFSKVEAFRRHNLHSRIGATNSLVLAYLLPALYAAYGSGSETFRSEYAQKLPTIIFAALCLGVLVFIFTNKEWPK